MPKFQVRVSQRVFYDVEVEAESFAAARAQVQDTIVDGDAEGDLDMTEVDSGDWRVEEIQTDENGDAVVESAGQL